jgi:hypothetical protein
LYIFVDTKKRSKTHPLKDNKEPPDKRSFKSADFYLVIIILTMQLLLFLLCIVSISSNQGQAAEQATMAGQPMRGPIHRISEQRAHTSSMSEQQNLAFTHVAMVASKIRPFTPAAIAGQHTLEPSKVTRRRLYANCNIPTEGMYELTSHCSLSNTIHVQKGKRLTIVGIGGGQPKIDGGGTVQVFTVEGNLTLDNVNVTNGRAVSKVTRVYKILCTRYGLHQTIQHVQQRSIN